MPAQTTPALTSTGVYAPYYAGGVNYPMTLQDGIDMFLAELRRRGYSERTIHAYLFDLEKLGSFLSEKASLNPASADISSIDSDLLRRWIDNALFNGNKIKTVARKVATIKSMFRFLYQEGKIEHNPTDKLRLPRLPKKPPSALSQDEIRQLLAAPDPADKNFLLDRAVLLLLYSAGLRVSELASLRMENINLERRAVIIFGKGSKERILPLQDVTYNAVLDYFLDREKKHPKTVSPKQPAFVKPSPSGGFTPLNVRRIQYLVEKYGRSAGLMSHVHPHLLRHSIATHMIEHGANVEAVRQTLGHEDLATTSIYLKTSTKFLQDEHKKFNPTDKLTK